MNETIVVVNQPQGRVQKTHCTMQTQLIGLHLGQIVGNNSLLLLMQGKRPLPPTPITPTMLLQVCIRAIYSSSEEVFEAELSPVYDGMCFGNGSAPHSVCACLLQLLETKQLKWQLQAGRAAMTHLANQIIAVHSYTNRTN